MGDLEERAAVRVSPSLSQISRQAMRRKPRGAPATIAPRERRPAAHPWPLGSTPGYVCRRVSWFCSLKGNEFFAEVEEDFIQDDFNLTGLSAQVPHYEFALDTILDVESPATAGFSEEQQVSPRRPHAAQACVPAAAACARYTRMRTCARHPHPHPHASTHTAAQESIESAAELLYGLIHARFIITPRGMSAMLDKYKNTHFGRCPRAFCQGQPVLPVGQSDVPRMHTSKVFCPKCSVRAPRSPPLPSTSPPCPPLPPLPKSAAPASAPIHSRAPAPFASRTFTTLARNAKPTWTAPTSAPPSVISSCKPTGTSCHPRRRRPTSRGYSVSRYIAPPRRALRPRPGDPPPPAARVPRQLPLRRGVVPPLQPLLGQRSSVFGDAWVGRLVVMHVCGFISYPGSRY